MTQAIIESEILAAEAEVLPRTQAADSAPAQELSAFRQWYMVGALTLLLIVAGIDSSSIGLIGDAIKADLHLSDSQLTWLIGGSFVMFSAILTLPAGIMVDRVNRRNLIGVGAVFWSAATVCTGLAHTFWQLFAGRAGVGFSEGVLRPAAFSMIRDGVSPERRGRAFAINAAGSFFGAAGALMLAAVVLRIAEAHGPIHAPFLGVIKPWQVVFFTIGLGGIPFIALVGLIVEPVRRLAAGETVKPGGWVAATLGYGDAVRFMLGHWRQYAPLMGTAIMFGMVSSAVAYLSPSMIHRNYDIPLSKVGLIMGPIVFGMSALGLMTSGFVIDRLTKRGVRNGPATVVLAAVALIAVPAIAGPLMPTLPGFLVFYGLVLFAGGLLPPGIQVMNTRITPSLNAGKIFVLFNLSQSVIGVSAGTYVAGLLSDKVFRGQFALAHGVSLTGAIFILPALIAAWWVRQAMTNFVPPDEARIQSR